ncbi:unnamed protein product, partial [Discosporangium mesarthrocarpum]
MSDPEPQPPDVRPAVPAVQSLSPSTPPTPPTPLTQYGGNQLSSGVYPSLPGPSAAGAGPTASVSTALTVAVSGVAGPGGGLGAMLQTHAFPMVHVPPSPASASSSFKLSSLPSLSPSSVTSQNTLKSLADSAGQGSNRSSSELAYSFSGETSSASFEMEVNKVHKRQPQIGGSRQQKHLRLLATAAMTDMGVYSAGGISSESGGRGSAGSAVSCCSSSGSGSGTDGDGSI